MFLYDAWYVGAFGDEISQTPMRRVLLDHPIVFYRTTSNETVALNDICPHRQAPLHLGKVVGDAIACPYHGLAFDPTGRCVHNPNAEGAAPGAVRARHYPTVERDGMAWIWMGDPALADPAKIQPFDLAWTHEGFDAVKGYLHIEASEPLISDNLLDLSHAEHLHPFLANPGMSGRMRQQFRQEGNTVHSNYSLNDEPLTPIIGMMWDKEPIKRADIRFNMRWDPPSNLLLEIGAHPVGAREQDGITAWNSHLLTPETARATHYFWSFARNSKLGDPEFDLQLQDGITQAFVREDAPMIEWQQKYRDLGGGDEKPALIKGDTGAVMARRVVSKLMNAMGVP